MESKPKSTSRSRRRKVFEANNTPKKSSASERRKKINVSIKKSKPLKILKAEYSKGESPGILTILKRPSKTRKRVIRPFQKLPNQPSILPKSTIEAEPKDPSITPKNPECSIKIESYLPKAFFPTFRLSSSIIDHLVIARKAKEKEAIELEKQSKLKVNSSSAKCRKSKINSKIKSKIGHKGSKDKTKADKGQDKEDEPIEQEVPEDDDDKEEEVRSTDIPITFFPAKNNAYKQQLSNRRVPRHLIPMEFYAKKVNHLWDESVCYDFVKNPSSSKTQASKTRDSGKAEKNSKNSLEKAGFKIEKIPSIRPTAMKMTSDEFPKKLLNISQIDHRDLFPYHYFDDTINVDSYLKYVDPSIVDDDEDDSVG